MYIIFRTLFGGDLRTNLDILLSTILEQGVDYYQIVNLSSNHIMKVVQTDTLDSVLFK